MITRKFKRGDRVRIKRDSMFAHQSNKIGTIDFIRLGEDFCYGVIFGNYHNAYRGEDLELAKPEVDLRKSMLTSKAQKGGD